MTGPRTQGGVEYVAANLAADAPLRHSVFGAGYGGNIALMPAMIGHCYGTESLGTVTGIMFTSASVGSLSGPPLAGLLLGVSGDYLLPAVATVAVATLGTVGQVLLPPTHRLRRDAVGDR